MKMLDVLIIGAILFFVAPLLVGCASGPQAQQTGELSELSELNAPTAVAQPATKRPSCSDNTELELDAFFALNESSYDTEAQKIRGHVRPESEQMKEIVKLIKRGCAGAE